MQQWNEDAIEWVSEHCMEVLVVKNSSDARHGELKACLQNEYNFSVDKHLNSLSEVFKMLNNPVPTKQTKLLMSRNTMSVEEEMDLSFYQESNQ